MSWNENKPAANDPLNELPSVLTANAIAFRQAIEKHSYWTDGSGVSAGQTRFSDGSFGPGSFRAFFDVQSSLSTAQSAVKPLAGRLFLTSDTQRLFGFASNATMPLGSKNMIAFVGGSAATLQSNTRVLVQNGTVVCAAAGAGSATITFDTAYSVAPIVQLMPMSAATTILVVAQANTVSTTGFSLSLSTVFGGSSNFTVMWRSYGTVVL
jgi:hypothetical protein